MGVFPFNVLAVKDPGLASVEDDRTQRQICRFRCSAGSTDLHREVHVKSETRGTKIWDTLTLEIREQIRGEKKEVLTQLIKGTV